MRRFLILSLFLFTFQFSLSAAENFSTLLDFRTACENQSILATHPFYPDSVWNSWINEACIDLASYRIIEKLDTIYWTSGTMTYALNSDFIQIIGYSFLRPVKKSPLNFIPIRDVNKQQTGEGETRDFWQVGKGASAIVGFYPVPTKADTFLIAYAGQATYLDLDTTTTNIPYSYRPLIVDYVVCRALLRDGKKSYSDNYYESYMDRLKVKLGLDNKPFDVLIKPKIIGQ